MAADILARGWGYATVGYGDIQPDRANAWTAGRDRPDARGRPDSARAGRVGHDQRLGMGRQPRHRLPRDRQGRGRQADRDLRALAARARRCCGPAAQDERIAAVFSSCSGRDGRVARPPRLGRDGGRHGAELRLAVRRQLPEVGRPLERHAGRCPHADRALRAAAGVRHRRHDRISGPTRRASSWPWWPPGRCTACWARRISASPSCRRSTRPSSPATSGGTTTPAGTRRRPPTGTPSSSSWRRYFR